MTREEMVALHLQSYLEGMRELGQLEELLACFHNEPLNETIRALSQPKANLGDRVQEGRISNPTPRIAEIYRRVNARQYHVDRESLVGEITQLREGLGMIRQCVEGLAARPRRILERLYFQGMTWEHVMETEEISRNTLQHHRTKGIRDIARMTPYLAIDED